MAEELGGRRADEHALQRAGRGGPEDEEVTLAPLQGVDGAGPAVTGADVGLDLDVGVQVRDDVVAAVEAGSFSIYPVRTIDEGIELLTGVPSGSPAGPGGCFPEGSVNGLAEASLRRMAEILRSFGRGS